MPYIRNDQADISVSLDGVIKGDSWFSVAGGSLVAPGSKTRPGGMGAEVSVGSQASRGDVTVEVQMSDVVLAWHKGFEARVGPGRIKVGYRFLGPEKTPYGITHTVVGTLKECALPDMGGDSTVAMYKIVVECDEKAA